MKLHELDPAFIDRLENWGRYYAPERRSYVSTTHEVCVQLAVAAGQNLVDRSGERGGESIAVDADDARIIEWCWCNSAYRMDRRHWMLLRMHYVKRLDQRVTCRELKIRLRSYLAEVDAATRRFQECVETLEGGQAHENAAKSASDNLISLPA